MSATPGPPARPLLSPHWFRVETYEAMIAQGILTEADRVELIEGAIVTKTAISDRHAACVRRLNRPFIVGLGDRALVSVQNPIRLPHSRPEPDVALLLPREDAYARATPRADDVLLLIEVADSSVEVDRQIKAPIYARAGIREYWLVNLMDETIEVRREPRPDGDYDVLEVLTRGDLLIPRAFPGLVLAVDQILPGPDAPEATAGAAVS